MATLGIMDINLSTDDLQLFMKEYTAFMKEKVKPAYIGIKTFSFHVRLRTDGLSKGNQEITMETNKALNNPSSQMIRHLSIGFINGWIARGLTTPILGA